MIKATLAETAKAYTADAIATLVTIMMDKGAPAAARATCAFGLLDRGYGKPKEHIEANVTVTTLPELVALSYKRAEECPPPSGANC